MARVLLVNLASLPMPGNEPIFPIGVRCVQACLDRAGHHTELIDFVEDPAALTDLRWAAESRDVIGFSIRNIDPINLTSEGHVRHYEHFVGQVRAAAGGDPVFVGGGPGYSLFGAALVDRLGLDVGVVGPGEETMRQIAEDPGAYRGRRANLTGARHPGFLSDVLAHPQALMSAYIAADPTAMIGVETRRKTCYQECVYCPYAYITGENAGDLKPIANLAAEIEGIHRAGIRRIFFTDGIFNSERRYAKQVVRMLVELALPGLTWSAYFTPKPFDDEFAALLPPSNVESVIISPDSLEPGMMRTLGKSFDLRHVDRCVDRCRRNGLDLRVNVVFGGPGENRQTVAATAEYANRRLRAGELLIHTGFRVLPGTALARQLAIPDGELLEPTFYPVEPDLFRWIMADLDTRFVPPAALIIMMSRRNAARSMERVPLPAPTDAPGPAASHVMVRRLPAEIPVRGR